MSKYINVLNALANCILVNEDPEGKTCDGCPYNEEEMGTCQSLVPLLRDAFDVLTSDVSREPVKANERDNNGIWSCGYCGAVLLGVENYCCRCGKPVKWDD